MKPYRPDPVRFGHVAELRINVRGDLRAVSVRKIADRFEVRETWKKRNGERSIVSTFHEDLRFARRIYRKRIDQIRIWKLLSESS